MFFNILLCFLFLFFCLCFVVFCFCCFVLFSFCLELAETWGCFFFLPTKQPTKATNRRRRYPGPLKQSWRVDPKRRPHNRFASGVFDSPIVSCRKNKAKQKKEREREEKREEEEKHKNKQKNNQTHFFFLFLPSSFFVCCCFFVFCLFVFCFVCAFCLCFLCAFLVGPGALWPLVGPWVGTWNQGSWKPELKS